MMRYLTYPRDWTDTDEVSLHAFIQPSVGMARISESAVRNALRMYVDRKRFNPIADYLSILKWDGIPRLTESLVRYFNAETAEFARLVGSKFFIGMVARAIQPGCKRDEMLILEGKQGARKSIALNIIAGGDEYFLDSLPNMHDKESMMLLHGNWLIEVGELEGMRKSEVNAIKQFTASKNDKYRPPYGQTTLSIPRTSVFAATTNADPHYRRDEMPGSGRATIPACRRETKRYVPAGSSAGPTGRNGPDTTDEAWSKPRCDASSCSASASWPETSTGRMQRSRSESFAGSLEPSPIGLEPMAPRWATVHLLSHEPLHITRHARDRPHALKIAGRGQLRPHPE
ncbi:hypothetical protein D2T33_12370 [Sinirhodobacter populi]|uniref:Virulence-associated protein E-like domain-containing protein n=1 Tax=Paenirhodobacter populi TaxID=2306993 RepID=A0A443ISB6_9RHOB|nr:hypothetical protein D2T33_12370 [Sinirhodobacter populi]